MASSRSRPALSRPAMCRAIQGSLRRWPGAARMGRAPPRAARRCGRRNRAVIDSLGQTQPHQQHFACALDRLEWDLLDSPVAVALDPFRPRLGSAMAPGGDQSLRLVVAGCYGSRFALFAGMTRKCNPCRARPADAGVIGIAPVGEVVPAFAAWHSVVRHLVGSRPNRRCLLRGRLVQRRAGVLVRQHDVAAAVHRLELRARLDRELVERQMIRRQRECLAQLRPPGLERLAGPRIDQIERDAREYRPRRLQRGDRLRRRMLSAEHRATPPGRGSARRSRRGSPRHRGTRRSGRPRRWSDWPPA